MISDVWIEWSDCWTDCWGTGSSQVEVPNVVGLSQAAATSAIEAEDLNVSVSSAYSNTVALGFVISQSPSAGSDVSEGSTVSIVVSLGPTEFEVRTTYSVTAKSTRAIKSITTVNSSVNSLASGEIVVRNLISGVNTIVPPTTTTVGCVIIPPKRNNTSITLKGSSGDTGIRLHNTNPSIITLNSGGSTFILTTNGTISKVRFIWL